MFKSYEIDYKKIDRPTFFRSLGKYFHEATTLYLGGDKIADDVMLCYASHEGEVDLTDPLIWTYHGLFSQELMEQLAVLSENHDFVEILERLSLYKENELLLRWYNVLLGTKIWVSDLISEETTSRFAQELGLKYAGLTAEDLCTCILLPDSANVIMEASRLWNEVHKTLGEIKQRGEPYWWLLANKCRQCGQWWLVAQVEQLDVWCLRRLSQETANRLLNEDLWPPDFEDYSTLLRIDVSEFAQLFNLDTSTARMLSEKVYLDPADSFLDLPEEVQARIKRTGKRLASSARAVQEINSGTNRPSRSLTTDEAHLLQRIQQIYGNQNSLDKCVMTDEGDIAILVTNTYGRSVITVNLTFVADISREQNLTQEGIEVLLKPSGPTT